MSYYVIKLKDSNYLCELLGFERPQWYGKDQAKRFETADDARGYLAKLPEYPGRVVKVVTAADLKAERLRLRKIALAARHVVEYEWARPPVEGVKVALTLSRQSPRRTLAELL